MLDFSRFELLTFDCYGTLIDWETGIFSALKPVLTAHGKSIPDATLLELYGEFEAEAESGKYRNYREVLQSVVQAFGTRLSFVPTAKQQNSLPDAVPNWRPWPDTVSPRAGVGAVKPAEGHPDLEVPDLETLARHANC